MSATYIEWTGYIKVHHPVKPTSDGCNCGCGKDRSTVVREIMRTECLNEDQADARLDQANAARRELKP